MPPTDPRESELNPPRRDEEFGRAGNATERLPGTPDARPEQPEVAPATASVSAEGWNSPTQAFNTSQASRPGRSEGTIPAASPSSAPTMALVTVEQPDAPLGYRIALTGDMPSGAAQQDAAVLAYEYDRRRTDWWRRRRFGILGLPSLALICLVVWVFGLVLNASWAGTFFALTLILLVLGLAFGLYCWLTMPRVLSFGRAYRRLASVPLARGGIAWCDAAIVPPDFPALRDSFFTLYQSSADISNREEPTNAEDTERKKQAINDLKTLIKPVNSSQSETTPTPFISRDRTGILDRVELEALTWNEVAELNSRSLPVEMQRYNTPLELQRLAHDVETYVHMKAERAETALVPASEGNRTTPLHRQIAARVSENLSLVNAEIDRWRERATKEKAFHTGLLARYKEAEDGVKLNYERTTLSLEEEIAPTLAQLEANSEFYREGIEGFYQAQRVVIESRRDAVLGKLERERQELEAVLDERADEQALLQAEFKGLNEQRLRLENSTDSRFASLKTQLGDLVRRTYQLPPVPHFRSDYPEEPSAATSEETLQQLAELRAETRLATSAANNSLNRFARLRFEPLDELARLETQITGGTKWQATSYLVNLVNFKQSGQLLALAGEVSDSAGVYLDAVGEFERLNRRWCGLEVSIRNLGLVAYSNRLQEAQEYLLSLSQAAESLHSSLMSAPHSPEMARPATFQNIYDQAAGLQRELEELGALAGSITRTQERLSVLDDELAELHTQIGQNKEETERMRTDASVRLYEISQKLKQLLAKLDEFKISRIARMRTHIDELAQEEKGVLKLLKNGATELSEVSSTADKILYKHINRADRLTGEARQLYRGLENNLAGIVHDFEESVLPGRFVPVASELLVPVWFFQFRERPVWRERILGFASCYTGLERLSIPASSPLETVLHERASLWRFLSTARPATFYRLHEEPQLATLIGAQDLDYPAGRAELDRQWLDKLSAGGWVSRWLVRLLRAGVKK